MARSHTTSIDARAPTGGKLYERSTCAPKWPENRPACPLLQLRGLFLSEYEDLKGNRGSGELSYVTTGISASKCRRWSVPFSIDVANMQKV